MTNSDDLMQRLRQPLPEQLSLDKPGDEFVGTFETVERGNSAYGPFPIAVLVGEDGKRYGLGLFHQALRSKFAQLGSPAELKGHLVGIRYEGKRKSAAGNEYRDYRVVADLDDTADGWGATETEAGAWDDGGDDEPF